ncbi:MAG: PEP-CTERM sorting domain-containing protein [Schlesneria sp.]
MKRFSGQFVTTFVCLCFAFENAYCGQIQVVSDNQGWVNSEGSSNGASDKNNTFTGYQNLGNNERFNSWASFVLPKWTGSLSSVTLDVSILGFDKNQVDIGIYDVSTPFAEFSKGNSGVDGYKDLGTGNLYGTASVFTDSKAHNVSLVLSDQALKDINAAEGDTFILGFTNITANEQDVNPLAPLGIFINFGNGGTYSEPTLTITTTDPVSPVPEPSSIALMGLGGIIAAFGVYRKRNRQRMTVK